MLHGPGICRPRRGASSTSSCMAGRATLRPLIPSLISSGSPENRCLQVLVPSPHGGKSLTIRCSPPERSFRKCGESGIEISDFLPHIRECADDLAVIRSCWADSVNHPQAVYEMNTGTILMGKPCLGSWVSYGLGTENQDLPSFLVLPDPGGGIKGGPPAYGAGFLPASHQGTLMRGGDRPILDLIPPASRSAKSQRDVINLIDRLDRHHLDQRGGDLELEARIQSYELAFRMQTAAPEAVDLSRETDETRRLYGLDDRQTAEFGTRCLLSTAARRTRRAIRSALFRGRQRLGCPRRRRSKSRHHVRPHR